jgi:hypothetical protein
MDRVQSMRAVAREFQLVIATATATSSMPLGCAEAHVQQMRTVMEFATVPMRVWERWMRVECATVLVRCMPAAARRFLPATAIAKETNSTHLEFVAALAQQMLMEMEFVIQRQS